MTVRDYAFQNENVCNLYLLGSIPFTTRDWDIPLPAKECNSDTQKDFGLQASLERCAAMCDLWNGKAFAYGVQGRETCKKDGCRCKCWTHCESKKKSNHFNLYMFSKFIELNLI